MATATKTKDQANTKNGQQAATKPLTQADFEAARRAWRDTLTPAVQEAYNAHQKARADFKAGNATQADVDAAKAALGKVYGPAQRTVYNTYAKARAQAKQQGLTLTPLRAP